MSQGLLDKHPPERGAEKAAQDGQVHGVSGRATRLPTVSFLRELESKFVACPHPPAIVVISDGTIESGFESLCLESRLPISA
jgi:hypothetical protein